MSVARNLFLGREPLGRLGLIDFRRMHREADEALRDSHPGSTCAGRCANSASAHSRWSRSPAPSPPTPDLIMDEPTSSLEPREVQTLFG